MDAYPRELAFYLTDNGWSPFKEWFDSLKDVKGRAKIRVRLDRVRLGNFGDYQGVGEGVQELRIDYGPGYRVYYGRDGETIVILLCGGDKSSQSTDIDLAKQYWKEIGKRRVGKECRSRWSPYH